MAAKTRNVILNKFIQKVKILVLRVVIDPFLLDGILRWNKSLIMYNKITQY